ncbi:uncharacterized protein LOC126900385 isoform X1 [Daktulosphaira vitifoliae]|uniref:uncharacterized protein LOC126900385 isoform X1 n=1 Tax=Daktulosphaira vitifoliae TaxID=58002 RepID=UPI0021AA62CC|nr:uncharacterized protein LOC126900385 isoform X1 [Daktulosphaira vitifoliae]
MMTFYSKLIKTMLFLLLIDLITTKENEDCFVINCDTKAYDKIMKCGCHLCKECSYNSLQIGTCLNCSTVVSSYNPLHFIKNGKTCPVKLCNKSVYYRMESCGCHVCEICAENSIINSGICLNCSKEVSTYIPLHFIKDGKTCPVKLCNKSVYYRIESCDCHLCESCADKSKNIDSCLICFAEISSYIPLHFIKDDKTCPVTKCLERVYVVMVGCRCHLCEICADKSLKNHICLNCSRRVSSYMPIAYVKHIKWKTGASSSSFKKNDANKDSREQS